MVLKHLKLIYPTLLFSLCCLTACEDLYIVDCDECELIEPTTCLLYIDLKPQGYLFEVTIYKGKLEDGLVIYNTTATEPFYYTVGLNSEYTVTGKIVINGIEYTAVDATRPRVEVITDSCEETCYWVVNKNINLKFKYF